MASGYWVFILIFLLFALISSIFMFCYCFGDHGGRFFGSDENIASIVYTKVPLPKSKCRCSNKFKGFCKDCEGPEFVDDGVLGRLPDFSDFGGDEGFSKDNNKSDPIRGFLGNGTTQGSGQPQGDGAHNYGDQPSSTAGYSNYDGSG